jgi:hypothetical protein
VAERPGALDSAVMVNAPLPETVATSLMPAGNADNPAKRGNSGTPETSQKAPSPTFAQILGKLYFLQLIENLKRILFDYAQKRPHPANAVFNAAC